MSRPLAVDLCTGLHGWADGLVAEGWRVIGYDIEDMCAAFGMPRPDHVELVIKSLLDLHGSECAEADLIVASPPCQFFSYCAMPWSKAKALAAEVRNDPVRLEKELALFDACFRIQREACAAAGRHIPMVVENVRGAVPWVGRSRWAFGSFHLWGDVPALMPMTARAVKVGGLDWKPPDDPRHRKGQAFNPAAQGREAQDGRKNAGGSWFNVAHNTTSGKGQNPDGRKQSGRGRAGWFGSYADQKAVGNVAHGREHSSGSTARKAASALIAKIPLPLARHIGAVFRPHGPRRAGTSGTGMGGRDASA